MPEEEDGSFRSGMTAFREKRYEEAIVHFSQAIHNHSVIHRSFNALGVTHSKLGNTLEAEDCFKKALIIDPGNPTYEKNLGKVCSSIYARDIQEKPGIKIKKPLRKRNSHIMIGVTLVVLVIIILSSMQLVTDLQPRMGSFMKGTLQEGLLTPWMNSLEEEDRIFPVVSVQVDKKRIEFVFDRDQDLSKIVRIEAVLSPTKGTKDQQYSLPPITNPRNNLYYAIDDPYVGKEKHFVMSVYYQDDVSGVITDMTLPPR
jgi:tetratricopeptide (TPR) repeat protein